MSTLSRRMCAVGVVLIASVTATSGLWAADEAIEGGMPAPLPAPGPLSASLDPSGMVRVLTGETELLMIELNAHGPDWKHAPQETARAETADLQAGPGKRVSGTLPVPNTDGGALNFVQTVVPLPQGLKLGYDVEVAKTMKLNGLQVSILLPTRRYAGKELAISDPDRDDIETATLPEEQKGESFQVWSGAGATIEVAKGTPVAATLSLIASADVVVQDLRRWERQVFEIRFPAIMEGEGREVTPEDRFHLDLTVTFPTALRWQ